MVGSTSKKSRALRDRFRPDGIGARLGHTGAMKEGAVPRAPPVKERGPGPDCQRKREERGRGRALGCENGPGERAGPREG